MPSSDAVIIIPVFVSVLGKLHFGFLIAILRDFVWHTGNHVTRFWVQDSFNERHLCGLWMMTERLERRFEPKIFRMRMFMLSIRVQHSVCYVIRVNRIPSGRNWPYGHRQADSCRLTIQVGFTSVSRMAKWWSSFAYCFWVLFFVYFRVRKRCMCLWYHIHQYVCDTKEILN